MTTDIASTVALRRLLSPGQAVVIEGISANGEEYERWGQYHSRIQKVLGDSLMVSAPRRRGTMVRFSDETVVTVYCSRCGVQLRFDATVSTPTDSTPLMIQLVNIANLRRHDRREFVRVELMVPPVEFSLKSDAKKSARSLMPMLTDVSLGGFGLTCNQEIPEGSKIRLVLELPIIFGRVEATVEVRRIFEPIRDSTGKRRAHMGLQTIEMSEVDRDRIAAFVVYQQERMKRMGTFTNLTGAGPDLVPLPPQQ